MSEPIVDVFAAGTPLVQGNHRVSAHGRVYEQRSAALRAWRDTIMWACRLGGQRVLQPAEGPVSVEIRFVMPELKRPVRALPHIAPDVDKLARAVLDSITQARVIGDDGQVCRLEATKVYGTPPGARIIVRSMS